MTDTRFCAHCGLQFPADANFCPSCGTRAGASGRSASISAVLPWALPAFALVAVLGYAIGARSPSGGGGEPLPIGMPLATTDISQLSPTERVDRLFNRVMAAAEAGKTDSVAFFAPMAIGSFAALDPLTLHHRYDLALIHLVSGDLDAARANADTILTESPRHLLGLALGMRIAEANGDEAAGRDFARRFTDALEAERARALPEYVDHSVDIEDGVKRAAAARR